MWAYTPNPNAPDVYFWWLLQLHQFSNKLKVKRFVIIIVNNCSCWGSFSKTHLALKDDPLTVIWLVFVYSLSFFGLFFFFPLGLLGYLLLFQILLSWPASWPTSPVSLVTATELYVGWCMMISTHFWGLMKSAGCYCIWSLPHGKFVNDLKIFQCVFSFPFSPFFFLSCFQFYLLHSLLFSFLLQVFLTFMLGVVANSMAESSHYFWICGRNSILGLMLWIVLSVFNWWSQHILLLPKLIIFLKSPQFYLSKFWFLESLFLFLLKFGSEGFSLLLECTGISFWGMGNQIPLYWDKGWTEETGVGEFKSENPRSPSSSHKAMSTYVAGLGSSTASRCSVSVVEDNYNQALNLEEPWQKKRFKSWKAPSWSGLMSQSQL